MGLGDAKEWCSGKFYQEEGCAGAEGAPGPGFDGIRWRMQSAGKTRAQKNLDLGLGFQPYLPVLHLDGVFDARATILLADLIGLLLHEGRKAVQVAGD